MGHDLQGSHTMFEYGAPHLCGKALDWDMQMRARSGPVARLQIATDHIHCPLLKHQPAQPHVRMGAQGHEAIISAEVFWCTQLRTSGRNRSRWITKASHIYNMPTAAAARGTYAQGQAGVGGACATVDLETWRWQGCPTPASSASSPGHTSLVEPDTINDSSQA